LAVAGVLLLLKKREATIYLKAKKWLTFAGGGLGWRWTARFEFDRPDLVEGDAAHQDSRVLVVFLDEVDVARAGSVHEVALEPIVVVSFVSARKNTFLKPEELDARDHEVKTELY
jgi:hypothetical protein